MKVHLKEWDDVKPGFMQSIGPYYVRKCDMLQVKKEHAASLTDNPAAVTCKHCLKAMANR